MESAAHDLASVSALLERLHDAGPRELRLEHRPLRGGLEAAGVARVVARYRDDRGRPRVFTLVMKRLAGVTVREALVYEHLVEPHASGFAPRLLATRPHAEQGAVLLLESLRPSGAWPWRAAAASQAVLERAALLHAVTPGAELRAVLAGWDYEAELEANARRTLELLERLRRRPALPRAGAALSLTRRLVADLPALRRQLLGYAPFGRAPIHGDLHPGNVLLRRRRGRQEPVLLDWGRARLGSPLEDVSSWLQTLAGWEPEARRRHDTLLTAYLRARGLALRLDSELRAAYWLAGASNALAGALLHHLTLLHDETAPGRQRAVSAWAAREWLRVLRRAHAFWR